MRIEASDITAGYAKANVLHAVSVTLDSGEVVGLIGPNGSGKTTLLRAVSRVLPLRSGRLMYDGEPAKRLNAIDVARRIAFVPQSEHRLFDFTVRDVVLMGRHPHLRCKQGETVEDHAVATRAMALTDTLHLVDRPITELSGGEHRRVLIARALAQTAPVLLFDEPTAHLDITHQAELLALCRRLSTAEGAGILVALHDLNLASEYCDRLVLLHEGRLIATGPPDVVLTEDRLSPVYGGRIRVARNPATGGPMVLTPCPELASELPNPIRVHVICGGGSGAALLSRLVRRGYALSAGVVNRLDSDEGACAALGVKHVTESPFSPIEEPALSACRTLINESDVVVIAEMPFGQGNLANLQLASDARESGMPVFMLGDSPIDSRDFTGGEAARIWNGLLDMGAQRMSDLSTLDAALRAIQTIPPPDPQPTRVRVGTGTDR